MKTQLALASVLVLGMAGLSGLANMALAQTAAAPAQTPGRGPVPPPPPPPPNPFPAGRQR